jgi:hypothetical protein
MTSSIRRVAQGCALLALLAGCESTKSQSPSPTDAPREPSVEAAAQSGKAAASWQRARVGDRATYAFSTRYQPGPDKASSTLSGTLALEVVAVRQPWVWLKVSFTDEAGRPLPRLSLSHELLLPMRADETQALDVPREGTATAEQAQAGGRTWNAVRYVDDKRPMDGPLQERAYAVEPGPLYLANGLLEAKNVLSGFGGSGEVQLKLVEAHQGPASGATATLPELTHPLGPGSWFTVRTDNPEDGTSEEARTCLAAERGFLLSRELRPVPAGRAAPCEDADFRENASVTPLEGVLVDLVSRGVQEGTWPPAPVGAVPSTPAPTRGTLSVNGRDVPVFLSEQTEDEGQTRRVTTQTHAADPWHASLAGLPLEFRMGQLAVRVEGVDAAGKRRPLFSSRITGWGTWVK